MLDVAWHQLAYLHGEPTTKALFKQQDEDFIVEEVLGFELTGEGEHVCLFIEKQGENTQFVAKKIASYADVKPREVSYAGLKDRHGITRQWFSVPVPIKKELDWTDFSTETIRILKVQRHNKKLRTGCLLGNRFIVTLKEVSDIENVQSRCEQVQKQGVPNYFGLQRFGHDGNNLGLFQRMVEGERIRDKKLKGLIISSARSLIFNRIVSTRLSQHGMMPMNGDAFLLSGSRSFFSSSVDEEIQSRLASGDIQLSAPLVGKGNPSSEEDAFAFEQASIAEWQPWADALVDLDVKSERRGMLLKPEGMQWDIDEGNRSMTLRFFLPSGAYATAVIRELVYF